MMCVLNGTTLFGQTNCPRLPPSQRAYKDILRRKPTQRHAATPNSQSTLSTCGGGLRCSSFPRQLVSSFVQHLSERPLSLQLDSSKRGLPCASLALQQRRCQVHLGLTLFGPKLCINDQSFLCVPHVSMPFSTVFSCFFLRICTLLLLFFLGFGHVDQHPRRPVAFTLLFVAVHLYGQMTDDRHHERMMSVCDFTFRDCDASSQLCDVFECHARTHHWKISLQSGSTTEELDACSSNPMKV